MAIATGLSVRSTNEGTLTGTVSAPPYGWILVATMSLEQIYIAAMETSNPMHDESGLYLAQNAIFTLRQWVEYALQHDIKVPYSNIKMKEVETAAQEFYSVARRAMAIDVEFQKMCR